MWRSYYTDFCGIEKYLLYFWVNILYLFCLKEIYCTDSIYSVYIQGQITKLFPLTNFNKYLHYGTSGTEVYLYINISENKGSKKL